MQAESAAQNPMPDVFGAAPAQPPGPSPGLEVALLFDTDAHGQTTTPPHPLRISADLARCFVRASSLVPTTSPEPALSFGTLLAGLLADEAGWLQLQLQSQAANLAAVASHQPHDLDALRRLQADELSLRQSYATTVSARAALLEAERIARESAAAAAVELRHLLAAYPVLQQWHEQEFEDFGIDRLAWARALGSAMAQQYPAERAFWSRYVDRAAPVPLTSFSADVYTRRDLLDIDRGVQALAMLLASTSTVTPMALGVFGPWGSGKSFYMRHLQRSIDRLCKEESARAVAWLQARQAGRATPADAPRYHTRIAQVQFNAWHYNEGNLVASLVEHMFRNLRVADDVQDDDKQLLERQRQVLRHIQHQQQQVQDIDQAVREAQAQVDQAQAHMQQAELVVQRTQADIEQAARAVQVHGDQMQAKVQAVDLALDQLARDPHALLAEAAVQRLTQPLQDLMTRLGQDVAQAQGQFLGWAGFFKRLFSRQGVVVLILCAGAPAVAWLAGWLQGQWAGLAAALLSALPVLSQAMATLQLRREEFDKQYQALQQKRDELLQRALADLRTGRQQLLDEASQQIRQLQADLQQRQAAMQQQQRQQAETAQTLAERSTALEQRLHERAEAQARLARRQAELRRLTSAVELEDFLADRLRSNDYRKELGFLALVRRDIERLSSLIERANRSWMSPGGRDEQPVLNRIVLYIDDLDRCKESTVLAVLEAVHLLLAFPLFVCVVAVDPRWVEKCLRQARPHFFANPDDEPAMHPPAHDRNLPGAPTTVGDYLEKIFQIPLWMQPIAPGARARLVQTLLGSSAAPVATRAGGLLSAPAGPGPAPAGVPGDPGAQQAGPLQDEVEAGDAQDVVGQLVVKARDRTDPLRILPAEAAFLEQIAPLLSDRPRALKRLVNLYRLLKASLPDIERAGFVDDTPSSPHRVCLTQLALFTAQSMAGSELLQAVQQGAGAALRDGLSVQQWFSQLADAPPELAHSVSQIPDVGRMSFQAFDRWLPLTSRFLFHRPA
jgi:hypothetical protein